MRLMKATKPFFISLAAAVILTGCSSTGPNTERGAAAGAAIGAIGGAVLGNNVGDGDNTGKGAAIGAAAGAIAGGMYGNRRDREQGTARTYDGPFARNDDQTYRQGTYAQQGGVVAQPPPTPTSEPQDNYTQQPSPNHVWVRGHYEYTGDGRNYQWVPGHWEIPPQGARTYVAGHWQQQSNGYVWVPGGWQ